MSPEPGKGAEGLGCTQAGEGPLKGRSKGKPPLTSGSRGWDASGRSSRSLCSPCFLIPPAPVLTKSKCLPLPGGGRACVPIHLSGCRCPSYSVDDREPGQNRNPGAAETVAGAHSRTTCCFPERGVCVVIQALV